MQDKSKTYYRNNSTGEITDNHKQAVEMYRQGHVITVISWSKALNGWTDRIQWVH